MPCDVTTTLLDQRAIHRSDEHADQVCLQSWRGSFRRAPRPSSRLARVMFAFGATLPLLETRARKHIVVAPPPPPPARPPACPTATRPPPNHSGVPGMVARILGATVVLTEQDELLSLLDRNLAKNFADHPRGEGGIRKEALDWERKADTDALLASLRPSSSAGEELVPGGGVGHDGGEGESAIARRSTQLEFILCAE